MLNVIWIGLMVLSVICGVLTGRLDAVVHAVTESAKHAFEIALALTGVMTLWLGIMKVAEDAGLITLFSRLIAPIMRRLFPDVPADHPAMGAMAMNIAANMLGIGNAATPFGLKAMEHLQELNGESHTASNAMCMFLAINTSSVQLIPATAIALLAGAGASTPSDIIATALLATLCSTLVAIFLARWLQGWRYFAAKQEEQA